MKKNKKIVDTRDPLWYIGDMNTYKVYYIIVTNRGFYDTPGTAVALLGKGSIVDILDCQPAAPCRGKQGKGIWGTATCLNSGKVKTVFIEDGNFVPA